MEILQRGIFTNKGLSKEEKGKSTKKKKLHKNPNSISGKWQPDDGYLEFLQGQPDIK